MKLDVFPCGQVPSPGRVVIGDARQHAKLRGLQHACRDLHSQHLEARLPLSISAMLQAERAELFRGDSPALKLLGALLKAHDLRFNGLATVSSFNFWYCSPCHKYSLP